jgi:hypothetical protein
MEWLRAKWLKLLCRFGFHEWKVIGYYSLVCPSPCEECQRCGMGRQTNIFGGFTLLFSAEDMREVHDAFEGKVGNGNLR